LTVEMVSWYGASSKISDKLCYFIYGIRYLMVLVNVICVIMTVYTISRHTVCCAL
jgi:hypothetical protein